MPRPQVAILGGGPGGYEAALVAAQLGADVTVIDDAGLGGSCVLTDCVPSKSLIESSAVMTSLGRSPALGLRLGNGASPDAKASLDPKASPELSVDPADLYSRIKSLATAQSRDITQRVRAEGVRVVHARGRLAAPGVVEAGGEEIRPDVVLISTGAKPRELPGAAGDGERILTCRQLYDLPELPAALIVVGSGVTGAEFAGAYQALGSAVTLVSSRDRVLPHEDK
ncbi:MAG: FAD-dependent oxidoreductase, partial [Nocardiopsaceae bacterium]|nr:FAD-dependent oxidoreductase [Nocardiopsaceae bacterium]